MLATTIESNRPTRDLYLTLATDPVTTHMLEGMGTATFTPSESADSDRGGTSGQPCGLPLS